MATFAEQWSAAKKEFETATNKKKPSDGFKQKMMGNGVASNFRDLDGKKTAKDIVAQVAKVKTSCDTYISTLNKAAADPKDVPTADKPTYITAIGALKKTLERLQKDALDLASELDSRSKTAITPDQALQLKRLKEWVAARQALVPEVNSWHAEGVATINQLATLAATAKADLVKVKNMVQANMVGRIPAAVQACRRHVAIAEGLQKQFDTDLAERTKSSGPLMLVRTDYPTPALDPTVATPLKALGNTAFGTYNPKSTEYTLAHPKQVAELVMKIDRYADEADNLAGTVKPASFYVGKFGPLEVKLDDIVKSIANRVTKYGNFIAGFDASIASKAQAVIAKPAQERAAGEALAVKQWNDMAAANQSVLASANEQKAVLKQLGKQLATIPPGARTDGALNTLVTNITTKLTKASTDVDTAIRNITDTNALCAGAAARLRNALARLGA